MAPPELPPRKQPAPTTIFSLSAHELLEVFLRLPSLPSLVRAALACPTFLHAVRSSPAFRRSFRDLHSPSLLGVFLVNDEPTITTFAPALLPLRSHRRDPDHAAALFGLDAFLTLLPDIAVDEDEKDVQDEDDSVTQDEDEEDAEDEDEDKDKDKVVEFEDDQKEGDRWSMCGCRDGYVLLIKPSWSTKKVVVYDPVTRALHLFPGPPDELCSGESKYTRAEFHLIPGKQQDDRSFRVLCVSQESDVTQVAVWSPDTREWQISPTVGKLQVQDPDSTEGKFLKHWYWAFKGTDDKGTFVNGSVYWRFARQASIHVLNTATQQFYQIDLPPPMRGKSYEYKVGETNDGKLCLVRGSHFDDDLQLDVWVRRAGDDGVDKWMHDMAFRKVAEFFGSYVNVEAIIRGIVYISCHSRQDSSPSWFLSFCLETKELKRHCPITGYELCYPYIMAWPPSLVRNKEEN